MTLPNAVAVVDTNVLISGLIGKLGPPSKVLTAFRERRFSLATSEPLLDELEIVTLRPEVSRRIAAEDVVALWATLREGATVFTPATRAPLTDDPVDNALFMTAFAAGAHCIVTGDHKLLQLDKIEGVRVLPPRDFLDWLKRRHPT